jgi:hypothetical protein
MITIFYLLLGFYFNQIINLKLKLIPESNLINHIEKKF